MAQKKLFRFAEIKKFPNVKEYPQDMAGRWNDFFDNQNPICLELACGRGEYTVSLAEMHSEMNFIGVDVKGNRMYIGARQALEKKLKNAGFLRTQIEMLPVYFAGNEVNSIWITFPDPQLRTSKAKKRLTHPRFLRLYNQVLTPGGFIHLKTDSPQLFEFTKKVIEMYGLTLHRAESDASLVNDIPELKVRTHYESLDIAQSNKVFYLSFSLPSEIPDFDEELKQYLVNEQPV